MNIPKEEYETLVSTKLLLTEANNTIQEQRRIIDKLLEYVKSNVKLGKWLPLYPATYKCSCCGKEPLKLNGHPHKSNFCPNCGADMIGNNNDR